MDDLPADAPPLTVLVELICRSLPSLRTLLRSITPLAALVPDFLCSAALPLAAELGVPGYVFVPTSLTLIYLMRRLVELHDGAAPWEYRELPMPLEKEQVPEQGASRLCSPWGRWSDQTPTTKLQAWPMLQWLDCQPTRSVVYLSFGSAGVLSVEQTAELAAGLEASSYRFLWVVRMPSLDDDDDPLAWLPDDFLERTQDRGLAVSGWAPQVRVLSHPATAVFVSHCGWNSTLESAVYGVPMLAWPLCAEQRMNAVVLERSLGVALRPRPREDGSGMVAHEEVAAAVKELMEGEKGACRAAPGWRPASGGGARLVAGRAVASGAGGCRRQVEGSAQRA
ncbi:hypothetical protein ACQ4PT_024205 [Festuca glaucescens]